MITLEIYPESKKILMSFLYVCFTFASDMDYAKHDKRVNKNPSAKQCSWNVERALIKINYV